MDETPQETTLPVTEPVVTEQVPETTAGTVPAETEAPAPASEPAATEAIPETTAETVAMTTEPVYIDVIESVGNDIVHSFLFGSFLICGTLVGLALFRRIYGT